MMSMGNRQIGLLGLTLPPHRLSDLYGYFPAQSCTKLECGDLKEAIVKRHFCSLQSLAPLILATDHRRLPKQTVTAIPNRTAYSSSKCLLPREDGV